jgi:hypothetical protein
LGLKENIDAVKKEISTEEQFLGSIIRAEGFLKKYKNLLIALAVLLIVAALANIFYKSSKEKSYIASNEAYTALQTNPNDKEALETLKSKNPKLYELFLFSNEIKSADASKLKSLKSKLTDPVLKDLLSYQASSLTKKDLNSYSVKQKALLKEFAKIQEAYLLLKEGKTKEAAVILSLISADSPLAQMAQSLKHYIK